MRHGIPNEAIFEVNEQVPELLNSAFEKPIASSLEKYLKSHDQKTWEHCMGVAKLMGTMALESEYGQDLPAKTINEFIITGGIHDIGKTIMNPGKISSNERFSASDWITIEQHPLAGYVIGKEHFPDRLLIPELVLVHHSLQSRSYPDESIIEALIGEKSKDKKDILNFGTTVIAIADQAEARIPTGEHNTHQYRDRVGYSVGDLMNSMRKEIIQSPNFQIPNKTFFDLLAITEVVLSKTVEYYSQKDLELLEANS